MLYRDGLIIALFAADPLRLANITALEIGRTLIKDGTTWSVDIPAEETKNGRPHLAVLPDWSVPCIDRYVHHYRPMFRNAAIDQSALAQPKRPAARREFALQRGLQTDYGGLRQAHQSASVQVLLGNQHCRSPRGRTWGWP